MKINLRLIVFLLILNTTEEVKAQDPVFTQFMLVPETINSAFTGVANARNAGIINRRQWADGDRRIDTRYGYYNAMVTDQLALGGSIVNHYEVFTHYNFTQANAAVSYRVELDSYWRLRLGLEGGLGLKSFRFGNLLLEDQINTNDGSIGGGSTDPGVNGRKENMVFPDISAGFVVDREEAWFGVALKHMNRPNISFIDERNVPLDMFLSIHGGYYLTMEGPAFSVLPEGTDVFFTFNYMRQSQYNRLDLGTVVEMPMFSLGVIAATNPQRKSSSSHFITSLNPIASMKLGEFTFGISRDFNTSKIGRNSGIYEFTITWQSNHTCNKCDNYKVKLKRNGEAGYTH
jgi:type IX secretion system PorP/SprF family membrane protein